MRYGVTKDEAHCFGLPCGGSMELVVEPKPDLAAVAQVVPRINGGQLIRRVVKVGQYRCKILAGSAPAPA
jgi:xanthine dehydrogenase accessory factor